MKGITINKTIYKKIAASVAVVFSILSIKEGSQVLLGITLPDYVVLTPLLIYNVAMGGIGVLVGIALWLNHRWALLLTTIVAAAHIIVLFVVGVLYFSGGAAAMHSIQAMSIRVVVWLVIALLVWKSNQSVGNQNNVNK